MAEQVTIPISDLPSALEHLDDIRRLARDRRIAVFLDYDGTLTPIVDHPANAVLPEPTRDALQQLAATLPLAVVSGRDLDDVRTMVGLSGVWYAGSHGFDIAGPSGERVEKSSELLPTLAAAETELRTALAGAPGAWVERKRFALAAHYRQVEDDRVPEVEAAIDRVAAMHPELRKTGGKKVFELRPAMPWDKGKALEFLFEAMEIDGPDLFPLYLGDDETDEDAFRVIRDRGLGVAVRGERDERPTHARYSLNDPAEVPRLLLALSEPDGG
jgi:trehalose-phosphatase